MLAQAENLGYENWIKLPRAIPLRLNTLSASEQTAALSTIILKTNHPY